MRAVTTDKHKSNSGLLEKLIAAGKEYIFISNVDNLGAVVDLNIMQTMIDNQAEYVMEVTDKTKADVKGGTIIDYDGQVRLLEVAQVPKDHLDEFCSTRKFKVSSTVRDVFRYWRGSKRRLLVMHRAVMLVGGRDMKSDKTI